jgi:hypothetical protein
VGIELTKRVEFCVEIRRRINSENGFYFSGRYY